MPLAGIQLIVHSIRLNLERSARHRCAKP